MVTGPINQLINRVTINNRHNLHISIRDNANRFKDHSVVMLTNITSAEIASGWNKWENTKQCPFTKAQIMEMTFLFTGSLMKTLTCLGTGTSANTSMIQAQLWVIRSTNQDTVHMSLLMVGVELYIWNADNLSSNQQHQLHLQHVAGNTSSPVFKLTSLLKRIDFTMKSQSGKHSFLKMVSQNVCSGDSITFPIQGQSKPFPVHGASAMMSMTEAPVSVVSPLVTKFNVLLTKETLGPSQWI